MSLLGGFQSAYALDVKDLRFGIHPDKIRMVLELDQATDYRVFHLKDPYRLVIDLPRFGLGFNLQNKLASLSDNKAIKNIRSGHLTPSVSRMVIDLKGPYAVDTTFLLPPKQGFPSRLVVDFTKQTDSVFQSKLDAVFGTLTLDDIKATHNIAGKSANQISSHQNKTATVSPTPPQKPKAHKNKRYTIIIDPGHGGVDPGAIAFNGAYEKDVVLKLSHELKRQLQATGKFDVKMTRHDDRFLRLHDRVAYARRHKGDLFLSIHADSLERSSVSGASVYTLSERASDAQTAKLAQRENQADLIAGIDLGAEEKEVANILIDLAMRDTMNQSSFFANTLVSEMQRSNINTLQNPHRYAGFAVLKAPDIPSVLVEAGFLSNKREANMLIKSSYRSEVAKTIVNGILAYYEKVERNRRS